MSNRPSEESEASRLKLRFKKTSDRTKVFEEWDASVKTFFRERAQFEEGELPIVAFYQTDSCWFLITSRRLLWSIQDQTSYELRHDNVQSVGWSSGPDQWSGRDPSDPPDTEVYTAYGKGQCAHHSPWLHIIDYSGKRYEAFLEQGNLHGMRNSIWQLSAGWQNAFEKARQENQAAAETLPATGSDAYRARKLRINFERWRDGEYSILRSATLPKDEKRTKQEIAEEMVKNERITLFEHLDQSAQQFLKEQAELQDSEIPILAYQNESNAWLQITSRRVLWSINSERQTLRFGEIESSGLSYGPFGTMTDWAHPAEIRRLSTPGRATWITKVADFQSPWIFLTSFSGRRYEIYLEPGREKFLMQDAIVQMIRVEGLHPRDVDRGAPSAIERTPKLFHRVKGLFKTFTDSLIVTPSVDQINGVYGEIVTEWIALWKELTGREHYLSSGRPEKYQEFTMVGDSISFKTPEFALSSAENLQDTIVQLEKTFADLAPQSEALSRIRKLILWAGIMLEPSAFNEIAREYLRIARLVVNIFRQCRKEKYAPDSKMLDMLILNCDELEYLLIKKMEHAVQEFISTGAVLPSLASLLDLELSLRRRMTEAADEVDRSAKKIAMARSEVEIDCIQYCQEQQMKWEKTRDAIQAVLSVVEKAILARGGRTD